MSLWLNFWTPPRQNTVKLLKNTRKNNILQLSLTVNPEPLLIIFQLYFLHVIPDVSVYRMCRLLVRITIIVNYDGFLWLRHSRHACDTIDMSATLATQDVVHITSWLSSLRGKIYCFHSKMGKPTKERKSVGICKFEGVKEKFVLNETTTNSTN